MSKIIFLNGCSSSGKTSLAKAIQHLSEEPWLYSGIDLTFAALPAKYFSDSPGGGEKAVQGVQFIPDVDSEGFPVLKVKNGPYAEKFSQSIPKIIKQLADDGHNLVIDEVIKSRKVLGSWVSILKGHLVLFVKVNCELFLMEEREIVRGDRKRGLARAGYSEMKNLDWNFDLQVDTGQGSPLANAKRILEFGEKFFRKI